MRNSFAYTLLIKKSIEMAKIIEETIICMSALLYGSTRFGTTSSGGEIADMFANMASISGGAFVKSALMLDILKVVS
jgi:hypothetical protein